LANVQVDGVPLWWEDSFPMAKSVTRCTSIAGIVLVLFVFSANRVLAWGDTAHRIICEIAFNELNSQARVEVKRLIRLDPVFFTFSGSCIWPDHPRKRSREHFVNLPRSATQLENDPCPLAEKCVVTAIEADLKIVADAGATDASKLDALKFLGHWIGDVHQPMHVSFRMIVAAITSKKLDHAPGTSMPCGMAASLRPSLALTSGALPPIFVELSPQLIVTNGTARVPRRGPMSRSRSQPLKLSAIASKRMALAGMRLITESWIVMSKEGLWLSMMPIFRGICRPSRSVSLRLVCASATCSIRRWVVIKREIRWQHSDIAAEDNLTSERFS